MDDCIICKIAVHQYDRQELMPDVHNINCDVCGRASYTMDVLLDIVSQSSPIYLLQGYTRYLTDFGLDQIQITTKNLSDILNHPVIARTVPEKLNRLLLALERKTKYGGDEINLHYNRDYPIGFAKNQREIRYLVGELNQMGLINATIDSGKESIATILTDGWRRIEQLKAQRRETNQCFVAMPFREDMDDIFEKGIQPAIRDAGYEPYRIDRQEHNDLIPFKMLADIRQSRFVVADFTFHIRGVYFEAGFAMGQNIPVIWICKNSDFDEAHFDIKQFNHILYEDSPDLYEKLKIRIQAIIT